MGEQRVALEDVAHPPLLRRHVDAGRGVEQHPAVDDDPAAIRPRQPGEALQGQRLARSRGAEQHGDAVAGVPRDVQREARQPPRQGHREPRAHDGLAPRRLATSSTAHESIVRTITRTVASPPSPVCTAE